MALMNCSECGREISDTAPSCPHCGAVYYEDNPRNRGSGFIAGLFKTIISFAIGSYILTFGLNWLAQGKPPHPIGMVTDLLRQVGVPVGNLDCQSIYDDVKTVSVASAAQNDGVFIRDMAYISTSAQSPTEVSCVGRATLSTGKSTRITYSKSLRNGQYWVEYKTVGF